MDIILNNAILAQIKKKPDDFTAYEDLFSICRNDIETNKKEALQYSTRLREICEQNIRKLDGDNASIAIVSKFKLYAQRTQSVNT